VSRKRQNVNTWSLMTGAAVLRLPFVLLITVHRQFQVGAWVGVIAMVRA